MNITGEYLEFKGVLEGHTDSVTAISTAADKDDTIVSSSRDRKVIVWRLNDSVNDSLSVGYARRALTGHSQCVQDVVINSDAQFALSGSWDKTLRLWDLNVGVTVRSFKGHTSDVNSVAFSHDNRQIVSGSRDRTIKLWNTLAECKYTILENQHTDWVSCVRFSPSTTKPLIVSCGWDKLVKVWNLTTCKLRKNLQGHTSVLYTVTISPDGSLCASGGKDGVAMLWDVNEGKHLYSLESNSTINALCFSPCNYWLCAATDKSVKIWDLENKNVLSEIMPEKVNRSGAPWCTSLNWSHDGRMLFVGTFNGAINVYEVSPEQVTN